MLEFSVQHAEVGTYAGSRDSIPRAPMRGVRGISVSEEHFLGRSFAIACIRLAPRCCFPSFRHHRDRVESSRRFHRDRVANSPTPDPLDGRDRRLSFFRISSLRLVSPKTTVHARARARARVSRGELAERVIIVSRTSPGLVNFLKPTSGSIRNPDSRSRPETAADEKKERIAEKATSRVRRRLPRATKSAACDYRSVIANRGIPARCAPFSIHRRLHNTDNGCTCVRCQWRFSIE